MVKKCPSKIVAATPKPRETAAPQAAATPAALTLDTTASAPMVARRVMLAQDSPTELIASTAAQASPHLFTALTFARALRDSALMSTCRWNRLSFAR